MDREELNREMQAKLEKVGLPFEQVKVFGSVRCDVHVKCISRDTAEKWFGELAKVFGTKPALVPHIWDAARNNGTVMCPTVRKGFLIAVIA
jgi:hypothetical protein